MAPRHRRAVTVGVLALAIGVPARARAQPASDEARAEALFNDARMLRDGGQVAEACTLFAESKRLAPGVGITLHLADCYDRIGKPASAWTQFREAADIARGKGDTKRAEIASARARALEPRLGRLMVSFSQAPHQGWQILVDGNPLPPERWNTFVAVDPGEHTVMVSVPGQPTRTLPARIEPPNLSAIVQADTEPAQAEPAAASAAAAAPVHHESAAGALPAPKTTDTTRTLVELSLAGVGLVGLGLGAFFVVKKNQAMSQGNLCDPPAVDKAASLDAAIAFTAGGIALASAVVLLVTTPHKASSMGITVLPAPLVGGGTLVAAGRF
jgi:hypothetical protein